MRINPTFRAVLAITAEALTTNAFASLNGFADSISNAYRFQLAQDPVNSDTGWVVDVRLVDNRTGQPVTNAEIFKRQMVPVPLSKAAQSFQEKLTPLTPDGRGGYLYSQDSFRFGETLDLAARVPGKTGVVRGAVQLNG